MSTTSETTSPPSLLRRIVTHWVVRLLLTAGAFVLLIIPLGLAGFLLAPGIDPLILQEVAGTVAAFGAIALVTRFVERRRMADVGMGLRGLPGQWGRGFALGAGFMAACVVALALLGGYRVTAVSLAVGPLLSGLLLHLGVGLFEEGLFRGILFRLLEEGLGSWAALAITAALFGAAHLANPQATAWGAAAIAIEAGVLLGAAYMATRSLWFVAGLHTAWNFFQGPVFGFNISGSGMTTDSLLTPAIQGPELLTGGVFGIEASLIAVLLGLALGVWFAARAALSGRTARALLWRGGVNRTL
ncbi:CPBP family intramembrane metalloprotease [Oscillochloris sp. ZM17-4]|uniref:CPBP family intramembrane glutamic endopeptidase n=1 Tax=Oscillochloris sp. ZM17-4 TaxID=2866714 RepID=UPI001C7354DB|nr:type II CAAX endopeptidase family protein [Oscillochloris sp. ZM17-4]MBX0329730.1 CPBP family intramembrane metalloprotease [Oscillochloris sp. ZM17-4]